MPFFTGTQVNPEIELDIKLSIKDVVDILNLLNNSTPYYKELGTKLFKIFEQEIRDKT